ncbi:hypothetical protein RvY_17165-2 [Ramazzottius varieornatus]|nr:hypothetical protein RvY_17165-2 [Ramazzottius varieornatus]
MPKNSKNLVEELRLTSCVLQNYVESYMPDQWYPVDPLVIHTGLTANHSKPGCSIRDLSSLYMVQPKLTNTPPRPDLEHPEKFSFTSYGRPKKDRSEESQCYYWKSKEYAQGRPAILKRYRLGTRGLQELW